jgi:hypothetical protein
VACKGGKINLPKSRCRTGIYICSSHTHGFRSTACMYHINSHFVLTTHCSYHMSTIYERYKKSMYPNQWKHKTQKGAYFKGCVMMTNTYEQNFPNCLTLPHTLHHKYQNTELNDRNMLKGIISRREFYLQSTRDKKCWVTNKKVD